MDLNDNGKRLLATLIICSTISIVVVAARFWCQYSLRRKFHADDWWILATVVTYLGGQCVVLWGLTMGTGGMELPEIVLELAKTPSEARAIALENYLKSLYIAVTMLFVILYEVKMSICIYYRQIFTTQQYRILSLMIMIAATAWFIAVELTDLCYCIPMDRFWHPTKPGRCLNFNLFYLAINIVETVIDTAILALPIRAIFKVQLALKTQLIVSGIFLLGGFAIITNILRIYYSYQPNVEYIAFIASEIWGNIHITMAILCACLPTYMPLRMKAARLLRTLRDMYSSTVHSGLSSPMISVSEDNTDGLEPKRHIEHTEINSHNEPV
ncbi:hypothetical protein K449DRAFT_427630 [Hypoxylon sp. EC38]|nr:hypothetical protein K449DRAFT_427630 [Hypoxylon sp. EC38]